MKVETKPDAYILDSTASNRSFWRKKEDKRILWIDIEPELEVKPDLVLDCTDTGFPDNSFHTIIFDPPHWWGDEIASNFWTCRNKQEEIEWRKSVNSRPRGYTYYGTDKYKTKGALIKFLHKAQLEFHRILWDNGLLWLNWCEIKISLDKVLAIFTNWDEMLRIPVGSNHQTMGDSQNYWVMLMKNDRPESQTFLTAISKSKRIES